MPTIYLLHFDPPIPQGAHYIGGTENLQGRLQEHRSGVGARLTRQAVKAGSQIILARCWYNESWETEKKLKGRSARPLCPICSPEGGAGLPAEGG